MKGNIRYLSFRLSKVKDTIILHSICISNQMIVSKLIDKLFSNGKFYVFDKNYDNNKSYGHWLTNDKFIDIKNNDSKGLPLIVLSKGLTITDFERLQVLSSPKIYILDESVDIGISQRIYESIDDKNHKFIFGYFTSLNWVNLNHMILPYSETLYDVKESRTLIYSNEPQKVYEILSSKLINSYILNNDNDSLKILAFNSGSSKDDVLIFDKPLNIKISHIDKVLFSNPPTLEIYYSVLTSSCMKVVDLDSIFDSDFSQKQNIDVIWIYKNDLDLKAYKVISDELKNKQSFFDNLISNSFPLEN